MSRDYESGATSHHKALGDTTITKRKRSRAAKKTSGPAETPPVSTPFPGGSAPIQSVPHGNCHIEPCVECNHAMLVALGIRRRPLNVRDYEEWGDFDAS